MRLAAALCAGAALGVGVGACGQTRHASGSSSSAAAAAVSAAAAAVGFTGSTTSSVIPPGQPVRGDADADNPSDVDGNGDSDSAAVGGRDGDEDSPTRASYDFPDADDRATFAFGHAPSVAEARAVASVVKRYYADAAAGEGAAACALLVPTLSRLAGEEYGRHGPAYLRSEGACPAVLALEFAHVHGELGEAIRVFSVRVRGDRAQTIISSRRLRASSIFAVRKDGSWKIETLIGSPLP
jgi:hypothetical protein